MSNKKIKKWIFTAVVFLLLCFGGFWLLFRASGITPDTAINSFTKHQESYEDTAKYFVKKKIVTEVTGFRTIDNNYGIDYEDSEDFRKMAEGLDHLISVGIEKIQSDGKNVCFVLPASGGMLNKEHAEILYCKDTPIPGYTPLGYEHWYYAIKSE